MSEIKIKVCGLTKLDQIQALIDFDIDFLGFILYEKSPRFALKHLNFDQIKSVESDSKVAVFVNESLEQVVQIVEKSAFNYIQLHGDENLEYILNLKMRLDSKIKIIKVVRVGLQDKTEIQEVLNSFNSHVDYFLFDTDSKAFGGTGISFDWHRLNELEIKKPYFLSGGISLENITDLNILNEKPFALDINSKFEISPGNKDLEKIEIFRDEISRGTTN